MLSASSDDVRQLHLVIEEQERDLKLLVETAGLAGEEFTAATVTKKARQILNQAKAETSATKPMLNAAIDSFSHSAMLHEKAERLKERRGHADRLHADFVFFCEKCLTIPYRPGMNADFPDGGFGPMILTDGQKRVMYVMITILLVEGKPLRVIILKSRQLGNTTLLLAFATWLMVKYPHYHVMLIIDKGPHARTKRNTVVSWLDHIYDEFHDVFEDCKIKKGGRGEKQLELDNGSMMFFESAEAPNPGTSEMIHFLIESEKPKWPAGRAEQVRTSVIPGIPRAKMTVHVDESTAHGVGPFKRKWDRVATTKQSETDVVPIFLPWYISLEYAEVPPPHCYDRDGSFIYLDDDEELRDYDAEQDRELDESEYAEKYGLSVEQVYFRRKKIKVDFDGVRSSFDQEYPTTPDHAYRLFQMGFFGARLLKYIEDQTENAEPHMVGFLSDAGGYTDVSRPILTTQVAPVFTENRRGNTYIRELPCVGEEYFIGADTAEGKAIVDEDGREDPDYNCFAVKNAYGRTVAYHISRIKPEHAWFDLLLLAIFYNMAWVNGERNNTGLTLLAFFWLTGYPNNVILPKPVGAPAIERTWTFVSGANRGPILNKYRSSVTADPSRMFCFDAEECPRKQYPNFVINTKTGKPEAASGFHDDIVFGDAHADVARRWRFGDYIVSEVHTPPPPVDDSLNVDQTWADEVVEQQGGFMLEDTDFIHMGW